MSRDNTENALEKRLLEAELIHKVVALASDSDSTENALRRTLDLICEMTGWPVGHVYMLDAMDPEWLQSAGIWRMEDPERFATLRDATERTRIKVGDGLPGRVVEASKPVWVSNIQDQARFPRARVASDLGVRAAFGFPVSIRGKTEVVLEFFMQEEVEPDTALLDIMSSVGQQLSRVFERLDSARALKESEALLKSAAKAARLGYWMWDARDDHLTMASEECLQIFGLDPAADESKLTHLAIDAMVHPDDRADYEHTFRQPLVSGEACTLDFRIIRSDGEIRNVYVSGVPVLDENGRYMRSSGTIQDVTERRQAENRFRALLESAPDATVIVDESGTVKQANRQAIKIFGHNRESIVGAPIETLVPERFRAGHPALRGEFFQNSAARSMGESLDLLALTRDGKEFPVEVSLSPIETEEGVLVAASIRDVTRRREAEAQLKAARDDAEHTLEELRRAQRELVTKEKLASLGALTAGIAHEIKNPLNFVNNFAETSVELLDELVEAIQPVRDAADKDVMEVIDELVETLKSDLSTISNHSHRADDIMRSMLMHARDQPESGEPTDLNNLIEKSLALAYHGERARDASFNIDMQYDLDAQIGSVEVKPQELTRVLVNLFANAFYATVERGETANAEYQPVIHVQTAVLDQQVEIRIKDNGVGIPAETIEQLFTPFFTTKPAGEGTGLGLSLSYDIIVQGHGGNITVDSKPGEYTEFVITLPNPNEDRTG